LFPVKTTDGSSLFSIPCQYIDNVSSIKDTEDNSKKWSNLWLRHEPIIKDWNNSPFDTLYIEFDVKSKESKKDLKIRFPLVELPVSPTAGVDYLKDTASRDSLARKTTPKKLPGRPAWQSAVNNEDLANIKSLFKIIDYVRSPTWLK